MLLVFVSCALVPVCTLALVSYNQVTDQLHKQSETRLWYSSKSLGMTIYERLLFLETNLEAIERDLSTSWSWKAPGWGFPLNRHIEGRFAGLTIAPEQGETRALLGTPTEPPALSSEEQEYLDSGHSLLLLRPGEDSVPRILLLRALAGAAGQRVFLIGQIKPGYLWGGRHENNLPGSSDFCVLSNPEQPLFCSRPERGSMPEPIRSEVASSPSGYLEWTTDRQSLIAGYWSLFLKARFQADSWIVIVSEPRSNALAPIAEFHKTFPLTLLLSLCIVMLFSLTQIRRNLVPLAKLQEGTKRVATQDFDIQIEVASGDEFEELAESFNTMAERLGQQFRLNATKAEIDRSVLAALDLPTLVDQVLTLAPKIFPCHSLSLTVVDPSDAAVAETYTKMRGSSQAAGRDLIELTPDALDPLQTQSEIFFLKSSDSIPSYLASLNSTEVSSYVVLPLRFKLDLLGILAFGVSEAGTQGPERLAQVRSIADQLAIALSNVRMIQQINFLAYYDSLTGLPNRTFFRERLQQALQHAQRQESLLAVLFVDLDSFKRINDTLGHGQGDELLRAVAGRMLHSLTEERRESDEFGVDIARLGGDEFTIMLSDIGDAQKAAHIARRTLATVSQPFALGSQEVCLTASIGITIYPLDGDNTEDLLKNADVAMYEAKNGGRNGFRFYRKSMNEQAFRLLSIESKLRKALENEELLVHYQPIVDARAGSVIGVEALLRWQDPELGLVPTEQFIWLAEETGLIVPLGERVLRAACAQNFAWQSAGHPPIRVSVNVSARQFRERTLVETVERALADAGLSPEHLVLEITESVLIESVDATAKVLRHLKDIGVQLSIDDFGTGYSSLSYLKHFPVDHLKIDRSFVRDVTSNSADEAIAAGIIVMAHTLGLKVIAEGVETEAQLELLRAKGCDALQGYLFGRAIPGDSIPDLLRRQPHLGHESA